ncbi:Arf-GAP with [Collichthys lucidus]|uniref:Arf-GAP with n=1 Tax=Collichthys lucidus TaxID=240159 RepID=A0A4U5VVS5_COLLU|nr:Arf-GAP with [Collichthys lucidus]
MPSEKLASVFSSCLFQTRGQTPQETSVVCDLISNYITLFNFSPAGDLIFEVYLEKKQPENCCLIKVSPSMRSTELVETALSMRNIAFTADDFWTTFEVIENGELERPLHHSEKILEQVLEWSNLDYPSSAFLVIKKFSGVKRATDGKGTAINADQKQFTKSDCLKFSDGSSKLLSGHKFQDKYVVLRAEKLLLYRDIKGTKAEKAIQLKSVKCYLGLKRKLKPPPSWGFTVYTDKQQWHFCCERREAQVSWVTDIIRMKYGSDLCPKSVNSKEVGDQKTSRAAAAVTDGQKNSTLNNNFSKQPTDRRISLDDVNARSTKDAALHHKTSTTANSPKQIDMFKAPEIPHRRRSVDACQPQRFTSTLPSRHMKPMPLPLPPQSGCKTIGKRPVLGREGIMPPNLLSELNSVLSKTGRSAKSND